MDWKYKPSGGVVGLARKAGELYGGTVWFKTSCRVWLLRC